MTIEKYRKLNCLETYLKLEKAVAAREPFSLIRLGDGEGALMGYPHVTDREAVDRSFKVWFGNTSISDREAMGIAFRIREAVRNSDIVGLPRKKQLERHPYYQAVYTSIEHYKLNEKQMYTDSAIHRYLQFCLLFRKLLRGQEYLGVITPRAINQKLKRAFGVEKVERFAIQGEARFSGDENTPHYPDTFNTITETISPPFKGAIFLVGAGGLGKIYCDVIKQRGGIAIDIGALFDAWSNVKSRLVHPSHSIDCYEENPMISAEKAFKRFNALCDHFSLDTEKLNLNEFQGFKGVSW